MDMHFIVCLSFSFLSALVLGCFAFRCSFCLFRLCPLSSCIYVLTLCLCERGAPLSAHSLLHTNLQKRGSRRSVPFRCCFVTSVRLLWLFRCLYVKSLARSICSWQSNRPSVRPSVRVLSPTRSNPSPLVFYTRYACGATHIYAHSSLSSLLSSSCLSSSSQSVTHVSSKIVIHNNLLPSFSTQTPFHLYLRYRWPGQLGCGGGGEEAGLPPPPPPPLP